MSYYIFDTLDVKYTSMPSVTAGITLGMLVAIIMYIRELVKAMPLN